MAPTPSTPEQAAFDAALAEDAAVLDAVAMQELADAADALANPARDDAW